MNNQQLHFNRFLTDDAYNIIGNFIFYYSFFGMLKVFTAR